MAHEHFATLATMPLPRADRSRRYSYRHARQRAFTLIELMVAVAIIAILASIAWPAYKDYIMQARLTEATNALTAMQADMERYYQDNRTYVAVNTTATPPCDLVSTAGTFMLSCDTSDTAYAVQATGTGQTSGFTFTIDQTGTRATTAVPEDWGSRCSNAWIVKRGQSCT